MLLFTTNPWPAVHIQHSPSLTKDYPYSQDFGNCHQFTSESVEMSDKYENVLCVA